MRLVHDKWNYDERERKEEKNTQFHFEYSIFYSLRVYSSCSQLASSRVKNDNDLAKRRAIQIDENAQTPFFFFSNFQRSRLLTSVLDALVFKLV